MCKSIFLLLVVLSKIYFLFSEVSTLKLPQFLPYISASITVLSSLDSDKVITTGFLSGHLCASLILHGLTDVSVKPVYQLQRQISVRSTPADIILGQNLVYWPGKTGWL